MTCSPKNAAHRRYLVRFFSSMGLYVVFVLLAVWMFKHLHPTGAIAYGLAVLPALPLIASIVVWGLYLLEEQDEFQRNVLIQSMLWGIALTLGVLTVWGFLELFVLVPHFQLYLAYPLFAFFVGVSAPLLKRRYR